MQNHDDVIGTVANLANSAVKRLWPDATDTDQAKFDQLLAGIQNDFQLLTGQLESNTQEAQHTSLFVSGWRPFVGWVCGAALAYAAIIEPSARFISVVVFAYTGLFPPIDTDITLQILLGLLGLAGMRTFEKREGIAGRH
jgi:hypothetical protein